MTSAPTLLRKAGALLLDFDGPVAALMPPPANAEAADRARAALAGLPLPQAIATTTDHLAVLRYAADEYPDRVAAVDRACTTAEVRAANVCAPSAHAGGLLTLAEAHNIPVAMVSNNADTAVRTFIARRGWISRIQAYACRTLDTVDRMKPSPFLLELAAEALRIDLSHAVFVGDSISDAIAGKAAGVPVIGLAKNEQRRADLLDAGAEIVVSLGDRAALLD